jgi:hypothetical protein
MYTDMFITTTSLSVQKPARIKEGDRGLCKLIALAQRFITPVTASVNYFIVYLTTL